MHLPFRLGDLATYGPATAFLLAVITRLAILRKPFAPNISALESGYGICAESVGLKTRRYLDRDPDNPAVRYLLDRTSPLGFKLKAIAG